MIDIQLDKDFNPVLINGDFALSDATIQNQHAIVLAFQGEWKEHPEVGVGIFGALLEENASDYLQRIKRQLQYDGQTVESITIKNEAITINANY